MLTPKPDNASTNRISLVLTFNKTLPNIKEIFRKHWHFIQIKSNHKSIFDEPMVAYSRNINPREFIENNRMRVSKRVRKINIEKKNNFIAVHTIPETTVTVASRP